MTSLHALLAVTVKFDLKTLKLDAVKASMHADLDKTVFMSLSLKTIPQEPYVVQKDRIIGFFYVDDIVFAYKKNQADKVKRLHVIRNRTKKTVWLLQKVYISKTCNKFAPTPTSRPSTTIMDIVKFLPLSKEEEVSDASRTLYQRKVRSLLFAAIATRPDIAFAVSRLSQFNQRPGR